jgi:hypothetical protein
MKMANESKNPANAPAMPKGYKPMSEGVLKLEVPERDGYHRHWFRGDPGRIERAKQAGYTHVLKGDVAVNNLDLGGDATSDGNTDLGSLVSISSGAVSEDGQPERMYLMECPAEYFEYAQSLVADRNESVAEALRGGKIGQEKETRGDAEHRYIKGAVPDLFNPRRS